MKTNTLACLLVWLISITARAGDIAVVFNEIDYHPVDEVNQSEWIELRNMHHICVDLSGWRLTGAVDFTFPEGTSLAAGGFLVVAQRPAQMAPVPVLGPWTGKLKNGSETIRLKNRSGRIMDELDYENDGDWPAAADGTGATLARIDELRAESGPHAWQASTAPGGTPGVTNGTTPVFLAPPGVQPADTVVISEIMFDAPSDSPEQWVELWNKTAAAADLTLWRLSDGVSFIFPAGTVLPAGGRLVVAWDPAAFSTLYGPGVPVLGPFSGKIRHTGDRLRLRNASFSLIDEVRFYPARADSLSEWPRWTRGGGSSLWLNPTAPDNSVPAAWHASVEPTGAWVNIGHGGVGSANPPEPWNELLIGLVDEGVCDIDDVQVDENVGGVHRSLVAGGDFTAMTAGSPPTGGWRVIGNHAGAVAAESGNQFLRLTATGSGGTSHNQASLTLKFGGVPVSYNAAAIYTITLRARWIAGTPQLNTRLSFNRAAATTLLPQPAAHGSPGTAGAGQNDLTRPAGEIGAISSVTHSPAAPVASQLVTVYARISGSPSSVVLSNGSNGADTGATTAMINAGGGIYTATMNRSVTSATAAYRGYKITATFPGGAADTWTGGLVQWTNSTAGAQWRVLMKPSDRTLLVTTQNAAGNATYPVTVIEDGRRVYHHVSIRRYGAPSARSVTATTGYQFVFPPENRFRGAQETVILDRSSQAAAELLARRLMNAGGIPGTEDDFLTSASPPQSAAGTTSGSARLSADIDSRWPEDQYEGAEGGGELFGYEAVETPTTNLTPGDVESAKLPTPYLASTAPMAVPAPFPEAARWYWPHRNHRAADDFSGLQPVLETLELPAGTGFIQAAEASLDVDEWLRAFAAGSLCGISGNYLTGAQQGALLYSPPSGSLLRAQLIPADLGGAFTLAASSGLVVSPDAAKLLADPVWKRLYWGHVFDSITHEFTPAALAGCIGTYGLTPATVSSYVTTRSAQAHAECLTAIPPVPFSITTNGGLPIFLDGRTFILEFTAWVDVVAVKVNGVVVPVTFTGETTGYFPVTVPGGPGILTIQALNSHGEPATGPTGSGTHTVSLPVNAGSTARMMVSSLGGTEMRLGPMLDTMAATGVPPANILSSQDFPQLNVSLAVARLTAGQIAALKALGLLVEEDLQVVHPAGTSSNGGSSWALNAMIPSIPACPSFNSVPLPTVPVWIYLADTGVYGTHTQFTDGNLSQRLRIEAPLIPSGIPLHYSLTPYHGQPVGSWYAAHGTQLTSCLIGKDTGVLARLPGIYATVTPVMVYVPKFDPGNNHAPLAPEPGYSSDLAEGITMAAETHLTRRLASNGASIPGGVLIVASRTYSGSTSPLAIVGQQAYGSTGGLVPFYVDTVEKALYYAWAAAQLTVVCSAGNDCSADQPRMPMTAPSAGQGPSSPSRLNLASGGPSVTSSDLYFFKFFQRKWTISAAGPYQYYSNPYLIFAGASTSAGEIASLSNYGSGVDVFAPGASILAADSSSSTSTASISGTSASAAFTGGLAAAYLACHPQAGPIPVRDWLRARTTAFTSANAAKLNTTNGPRPGIVHWPASGDAGAGLNKPAYLDWVARMSLSTTNLSENNPLADSDQDGIVNGLEYTFGTNPLISGDKFLDSFSLTVDSSTAGTLHTRWAPGLGAGASVGHWEFWSTSSGWQTASPNFTFSRNQNMPFMTEWRAPVTVTSKGFVRFVIP